MNKFAGIIGYPLSHSLSPPMHNFIYQKLGIEILYKKWEIEEQNLELHIRKINNDDFVGANVTVPYKEKIVPFLDEIKDEAKFTGAVNTIVRNNNQLIGYNNDYVGFEKMMRYNKIKIDNTHNINIGSGGTARSIILSLINNIVKNNNKLIGYNTDVYGIKETLDIQFKNDEINNVVIFGAGGAAKAALYVLFQRGLKNLTIINRTKANAVKMVDQFNDFNFEHCVLTFNEIPKIKTACQSTNLIINTTILGMKGSGYENISPVDSTFIDSNSVIFDMVYNPTKTQLIKIALDKNANIIEGLNMLVYQAIKSIELWTGISPSFDDMYNKCKEILEGKLNNE